MTTDKVTPVRTICSWCKTLIHDGPLVDGLMSNGICDACAKGFKRDKPMMGINELRASIRDDAAHNS